MLRIVPHYVPRVSRSCELFPDGFDLHLLHSSISLRGGAHMAAVLTVLPSLSTEARRVRGIKSILKVLKVSTKMISLRLNLEP